MDTILKAILASKRSLAGDLLLIAIDMVLEDEVMGNF